jgi:hypothetical protein
LLTLLLIGCGGSGSGSAAAVSSEEVSLADVDEDRKAAEKAGAIAVRKYIAARLKTEKFITYDFSDPDKAELEVIIDDALSAWAEAEEIAEKAEAVAAVVEAKEAAKYRAHNLSGKNAAQDWAQELVDSFDAYPAGKKIRGLAAQLGVDAKKANEQLYLAKQIISADAEADAEMFDDLMKTAMVTKTVCKTGLFVTGVIVTGGSIGAIAGGTTSLMTAGGIVVGGADTIVDIGTTTSTIILGEKNRVTIGFNDIKEKLGPLSSVVGLMTFNPAETGEQLSYLGESILDFVYEGKVLGGLIKWENGTPAGVDVHEMPLDGRSLQTVILELESMGYTVDEETVNHTVESLDELVSEGSDISFEEVSAIMDDLLAEVTQVDDNGTGGEDGGDNGNDTGEETGDDDPGGDDGSDNDSDVPLTIGDVAGYYNVTMTVANPDDNPDASDRSATIRVWQTDSSTNVLNVNAASGYFLFDSISLTADGSSSGEYLSFSGSITGTISISGYIVYGIPYYVSGVKIP